MSSQLKSPNPKGSCIPHPLVLASASPRRREILSRLGVPFEVIEPRGVDEASVVGPAEDVTKTLALMKAEAVLGQMARVFRPPKGLSSSTPLVLGADTVIALGEGRHQRIMGKPRDISDARHMLSLLAGKTHEVWTGIAVVGFSRESRVDVERTEVVFRELTEAEIERYVKTGEPLGKAGAYAIQGAGKELVAGFSGCYENIVGLPLLLVAQLLEGLAPLPTCDCGKDPVQRGSKGCRRPFGE